MDGQAVFKLAVNVLEKVAVEALEKANLSAEQIDWLIPHQANIRIMQSTCRKLGLPQERMVVTVGEHGNTSAAASRGARRSSATDNGPISGGAFQCALRRVRAL
jgi:3-oxoacyl-[acyl-carrier-protein] synthase-3